MRHQGVGSLDRNGVLLQEIADQDFGWRTFVPFEEISPHLINATVASEDATFWGHEGVEPFAIARGALIMAGGTGSSGGSTISQQLVRSVHPEAIGTEFSIQRKWREALAAVAQRDAARALHIRDQDDACRECSSWTGDEPWPCPTVRALGEADQSCGCDPSWTHHACEEHP